MPRKPVTPSIHCLSEGQWLLQELCASVPLLNGDAGTQPVQIVTVLLNSALDQDLDLAGKDGLTLSSGNGFSKAVFSA